MIVGVTYVVMLGAISVVLVGDASVVMVGDTSEINLILSIIGCFPAWLCRTNHIPELLDQALTNTWH